MQVVIKLDFKGGRVHFGGSDQGLSIEGATPNLLADTFFSAICHSWSSLYGSKSLVEDLLEAFKNSNPPFLLSDLFPYADKQLLFPKPKKQLLERSNFDDKQQKQIDKKKLKKIQFFSSTNLMHFLRCEDFDELSPEFSSAQLWHIESVPQVAVSRTREDNEPYHVAYLTFTEGSGLWGLIEFNDDNYADRLKQALYFLGEAGLGGKRSSGAGKFELSWEEDSVNIKKIFTDWKELRSSSNQQVHYLLLSVANPQNLAESKVIQNSAYELITRKGFIYSSDPRWGEPVKKRAVGMIQAGAVLDSPICGRLIDVTPDLTGDRVTPHPIYRYGFALVKEVCA